MLKLNSLTEKRLFRFKMLLKNREDSMSCAQMPDSSKLKIYHILIVDDDEQYVRFILAALQRFNFILHHAENGQLALDLLGEGHFDLMLCDINMPKLDGFTLLEKANKQKIKMPPVLMLTGSKDRESVLKANALGAIGYIAKPATLQHLMEKIKDALTLTNEMLFSKASMPFKVECKTIGTEIQIFLFGCPGKDPLEQIKEAILRDFSGNTKMHAALIQVPAEFAMDGQSIHYLETLAKYLNRNFFISSRNTCFTGAFFGTISVVEKSKFAKRYNVAGD